MVLHAGPAGRTWALSVGRYFGALGVIGRYIGALGVIGRCIGALGVIGRIGRYFGVLGVISAALNVFVIFFDWPAKEQVCTSLG